MNQKSKISRKFVGIPKIAYHTGKRVVPERLLIRLRRPSVSQSFPIICVIHQITFINYLKRKKIIFNHLHSLNLNAVLLRHSFFHRQDEFTAIYCEWYTNCIEKCNKLFQTTAESYVNRLKNIVKFF